MIVAVGIVGLAVAIDLLMAFVIMIVDSKIVVLVHSASELLLLVRSGTCKNRKKAIKTTKMNQKF